MGRNRVYGSLEEARAEKNRRKRERRATAQRATKNDAPLGVCTLAVTAFNIREPNTMKQPNMAIAQSLLSSGSSLPSTENNAEQFPAENEQNVSASIANGANEVSTTNVSIGQSSLRRKRRSTRCSVTDPLATIATEPTVLPDVPNCPHCHAKRFHQEPPGFCCASGEIQLLPTEMPRELMLLYIEDSDEAAEFRRCVRSYNNMFAFTSIGIQADKSLAANYNGIYTFRIQGQMYHYINPLVPEDGEKPRNLQLYFFDTEHETTQRLSISIRFRETLVTKLEEILTINPYSAFFRGLQDLPGMDDYKIVLETTPAIDQRVFNKPAVSQVGAVWSESSDFEHLNSKHIQIYGKNGQTQIVKHYFACHDSLQYPLIFANGEPGWHPGIERMRRPDRNNNRPVTCEGETIIATATATTPNDIIDAENRAINEKKRKRNTVSCREYYCYKLQIRDHDQSMLLHIGILLQQYVVDMYVKIESIRLDFHRGRNKQAQLRSEIYQGIVDSISSGESSSSSIGKRIFLPASFIGGPRDMRRRYMDAMSLVQRYGKPDIFLTITCNKNWPEIQKLLLPTDKVENRPDLISRVFRAKLEQLKDELLKKNIFGKIAAYTYVIEFQKRGLPHAHFLIILKQGWKMYSPESYDRIVCAELPDANQHPYLHELVVKHMMHGPCGTMNPNCPCMKQHIGCKDNYPKEFAEVTRHSHNSYPLYRRRDFQQSIIVRGHPLDNRWEASAYQMPSSLRQLFASILAYCAPANPRELWLKYEDFLSEDIRHSTSLQPHFVQIRVLQLIDSCLRSMGKKIADYNLTDIQLEQFAQDLNTKEIDVEKSIVVSDEDLHALHQLNSDQKLAFEKIMHAIDNNISCAFFLDGPGGTGKTFLYRALLAAIRSKGGIALATATSGIAASILPGGRTAHSRLTLKINCPVMLIRNINPTEGLSNGTRLICKEFGNNVIRAEIACGSFKDFLRY